MSAPAFVCPMHADARSSTPGKCPRCHMALIPEGSKFGVFRHMLSSPLHIAVMVAIMLALMALAMKVM